MAYEVFVIVVKLISIIMLYLFEILY